MTVRRDVWFWLLVLFAATSAANAGWMLVDPQRWYHDLPAAVPDTGPYNEHFAVDAGAGLLATSVLLLVAAVWFERRVVQLALIGWLAFAIPHTTYHLISLDKLETGDAVANVITLGATVLLPIALLWMTREEVPAA